MKIIKAKNYTEQAKKALEEYLGETVTYIGNNIGKNIYKTDDGEEYLVVNREDAYEEVKLSIENLVDDIGLSGFTPEFQQVIIDECVDDQWFHFWSQENSEILYEDLIDEGMSEEEAQQEIDEIEESYGDDYIQHFIDDYGEEEFSDVVERNNLIDYDKLTDLCIEWDGYGNFLAYYDGEEIELYDGLFAYRME